MAQNTMAVADHHPYSPDLAPSDFYRFDHVKRLLGESIRDWGETLIGE
jgi:hypothetical protein